jgi:hypothetical protein
LDDKQKQTDSDLNQIEYGIQSKDSIVLFGSIAVSLLRIANAQEAMYELAVKDLNEAVEAAVESRAQEKADELVKAQTDRSFIGKR